MKKLNFVEDLGLKGLIEKEVATYRLGNHLDQVWTNLKTVGSPQLIKIPNMSDHFSIKAKLLMETDGPMPFQPKNWFHTVQDVKSANMKPEFLNKLK